MDSKSNGKPAPLLIADLAVINGIVMGVLYLSSQQWGEGILVVSIAVLGGTYLIRKGVYWPGQQIYQYWRRYVF